MNAKVSDWEPDFEVALRFLWRRWDRDLSDLLEETVGPALVFDDLDLDNDLNELETAVSRERLRRFALRGLLHEESSDDPALAALECEPALARTFVRLMAANLAFALRTDDLLVALVENARNGPAPRLDPSDVGRLLSRARSARRARELVQALPEEARTSALEAIEPMMVAHDFSLLHARTTTDELGSILERALAKRSLVSVPWIKARSGERYVVTRRRGGWVTLLSANGVARELARELSLILSPVVWAEKKGEAASFVLFERGRGLDETSDPDEVGGSLRALGIVAHDTKAPGKVCSLVYEEYVPRGENSPARLRKMSALGFAFLPPGEARKALSSR